jgi:hypothetical protein
MRSVLEVFGDIALATKDTLAYSADELDWGTIDPRATRFAIDGSGAVLFHRTGQHQDAAVVFQVKTADFNAADDFIPAVFTGAAATCTTLLLTGPQVKALLGIGTLLKGMAWVVPLPPAHLRFMRTGATPKSTGTLTACTLHTFIEYGPDV